MTDRHPDEDVLLEVALGTADAAARDHVTGHLAGCAECRRAYDELAGGIELVLPAVPRVAPPPSFETTALARLRDTTRDGAAGRRRAPRRRLLPVAAAALVGVAVGVVGAVGVERARQDPPPAASEWSAPLMTEDGASVGRVSRSYGSSGPMLVVDLSGGPAGAEYRCRLMLQDGTAHDMGEWEVTDDGANMWVVEDMDPGVEMVELVDESGGVVATAQM
ncbi:DUF2613 family protein [Georgenia alba]|uniref:DUF2613 family protein n=1 Tax=Georgenia alba TaxID=2233858 RepID=A0ABW2QCX0_9MICO